MKKWKSKKGFTLVEMLVCVLTLLLVGAICSTATGISVKSYQKSRFETDSQMLEATLDLIFSDMFRYATYVTLDGDNVTAFKNSNYDNGNNDMKIMIPAEGEAHANKFVIQMGANASVLLIGENIYVDTLEVSDFELKYDQVKKIFRGNYIIRSAVNGATKNCSFVYRGINTQLN